MSCNRTFNMFTLSLASSIRRDIRNSDINEQPLVTFSYVFPLTLLVVFGIISNIFSIDTCRHTQIRSTAVGIYLLTYSGLSLFGMLVLESRLFQILDSLTYVPFFITCNVVSGLGSIVTRVCIWMNGLIALQRALLVFEHHRFLNRIRSPSAALKQIIALIICICLLNVHELMTRVTVPDPANEGKFLCQLRYSTELQLLNAVFAFIHLLVPFLFNVVANGLILTSISKRRANLHQTNYWIQWVKQFRRHRHLFLAPTVAVICALPQLVISMTFSCVSVNIASILRLNTSATIITHIPQATTFLMFIYPSEVYAKLFRKESYFGRCLCKQPAKNEILPITFGNSRSNALKKDPVKTTNVLQTIT